jgi:hypothetical protein
LNAFDHHSGLVYWLRLKKTSTTAATDSLPGAVGMSDAGCAVSEKPLDEGGYPNWECGCGQAYRSIGNDSFDFKRVSDSIAYIKAL